MWLINSSIGRKVVMSVTGIALILFLTFHGCMNVVALFSGEAYIQDRRGLRCMRTEDGRCRQSNGRR